MKATIVEVKRWDEEAHVCWGFYSDYYCDCKTGFGAALNASNDLRPFVGEPLTALPETKVECGGEEAWLIFDMKKKPRFLVRSIKAE